MCGLVVHRDARYEGIINRSVHLDARNHEARTEVKSFVHQDARYEEIGELRTEVDSFVQQVARYEGIGELHTEVESFVLLNTKSLFGIMMHRM